MKYFYWFLLCLFTQTAVVVGVDHAPEELISSDDFMKSLCDSLQKTPTSLYKASFVWAEDFQLPLQHYACPESQLLDVMVEKQKEKIFHKIGVLKNKKMNITLDCFFSCEIYSDCVYVGYYLELEPASLFDIYVNIKI